MAEVGLDTWILDHGGLGSLVDGMVHNMAMLSTYIQLHTV